MARSRKVTKKRIIIGDPLYDSKIVARLVNHLLRDGKKTTAQSVVYNCLTIIKAKDQDPLKVLEQAISLVGPRMEVKPRRIGGASYQVPTEVRGDRRISLAIRWIVNGATGRSSKEYHTFSEKLAAELIDATQNLGEAIRKRNSVQKMAEANRAFAHLRW